MYHTDESLLPFHLLLASKDTNMLLIGTCGFLPNGKLFV